MWLFIANKSNWYIGSNPAPAIFQEWLYIAENAVYSHFFVVCNAVVGAKMTPQTALVQLKNRVCCTKKLHEKI